MIAISMGLSNKVRLWGRPYSFRDWAAQCAVTFVIVAAIAVAVPDRREFWLILWIMVSISSLFGMLIRGDHSRSNEPDDYT